MAIWLEVTTAIAALNIALLIGLLYVWVSNYRKFGTNLVLGLIVFGSVLLLENAMAIYFFTFSMKMLFSADMTVQKAVFLLRSLQFIALLFLTWVTMK